MDTFLNPDEHELWQPPPPQSSHDPKVSTHDDLWVLGDHQASPVLVTPTITVVDPDSYVFPSSTTEISGEVDIPGGVDVLLGEESEEVLLSGDPMKDED